MTIDKNLNEEVPAGIVGNNEIKELLMKNLQISKEMHHMMRSMKRFIFWSRVGAVLKLLIIFLPLVLGYIYLTPLLTDALKQYQGLLDMNNTVSGAASGLNLKSLPPEIQKLIPKK